MIRGWLPLDRHLECFHLLAVVGNADMKMYVPTSGFLFSIPLSVYLEVELVDHMVILCLTFRGTAKLFSIATEPFYISTSNVQGFQFLHILSNTFHKLLLL